MPRTKAFARYSLIGGLASAGGALAAAMPELFTRPDWSELSGIKAMFGFYALLGLVGGLLYTRIPGRMPPTQHDLAQALVPSRTIVYKLAALFSLDAFAGGIVVQSLLALWLFERFDLSLSAASLFFFWSGVLSAFSFPVAASLSSRFGLVNTMVFTHIPSSPRHLRDGVTTRQKPDYLEVPRCAGILTSHKPLFQLLATQMIPDRRHVSQSPDSWRLSLSASQGRVNPFQRRVNQPETVSDGL